METRLGMASSIKGAYIAVARLLVMAFWNGGNWKTDIIRMRNRDEDIIPFPPFRNCIIAGK